MSHIQDINEVVIDTNVFQHLLNPQNNTCNHINRLLEFLAVQSTALVVDKEGAIASEYQQQLMRRLQNSDDTRNEIWLLRYWILVASRYQVSVIEDDDLMDAIRVLISEPSEHTDRIFVYVAFKQGVLLISNDCRHIVRGPANEPEFRRDKLLSSTIELRPATARVLTSQEAHSELPGQQSLDTP